jgi:hypothetical protein
MTFRLVSAWDCAVTRSRAAVYPAVGFRGDDDGPTRTHKLVDEALCSEH